MTRKTKKRKFRTETITICSDAIHIIRSGDVAVDAKLTKPGKKYLHKRHGHVKLKLTLSETIKGTKLRHRAHRQRRDRQGARFHPQAAHRRRRASKVIGRPGRSSAGG